MQLTANAREDAAPAGDARKGKYLIFGLGREEFGIRVINVREIMRMQRVTAVPRAPAYIKGVINLRGKVIAVVDLRAKFGLAESEYTARTCIIVVQVRKDGVPLLMGIIVDDVVEVLHITAADIEDTPDFGQDASIPHLLGVAKIKDRVKILLDIEEALLTPDVRALNIPAA